MAANTMYLDRQQLIDKGIDPNRLRLSPGVEIAHVLPLSQEKVVEAIERRGQASRAVSKTTEVKS